MVDPGGRMNDDSGWQAFGERNRRSSGAATRPTFGGFDWQDRPETDGQMPGDAQGGGDSGRPVFGSAGAGRQDLGGTAPRELGDMSAGRESGAPGGEPSRGSAAAGRPPIRTTNGTGSASTPSRDESHGTSDSGRTDGDGSGNRAPSTPADGAPAQRPGAPYPGSIPPPPPASARFPDTPPASGGADTAGTSDSPSTHPRRPAPGPMPPASGAQPRGTGTGGASVPPRPRTRPTVPPRRTGAPAETASETTFRMRPVPTAGDGRTGAASAARAESGGTVVPPMPDVRPGFPPRPTREAPLSGAPGTPPAPTTPPRTASFTPDPALSWSAAPPPHDGTPGNGRPVVSFGEPEVGYKERSWGVRIPPRIVAVAACVVLGLGLIGGAVTGSWLIGGSGDEGRGDTFTQAGELWHSVPVDQLFPPTVDGQGAGPGGADRTWTRIAVAPDSGCKDAFDPLLRKALAPVGCERLLRATYTDATQSYVTTVGLLFTDADATAMRDLDARFTREGLGSRTDLMPLPYAARNTLAAGFGAGQRASWTISVLTDAPVVAYAVSGWADGRAVDTPEPAEKAMESGDTTPAAQAGLGNEAQGLADRVERALRKTVTSPPEQSS